MKAIYHGNDSNNPNLIEKLLHPPTSLISVDLETISTTDKTAIGIGIGINPNEGFYVPIWPQPSEILGQVYSLLTRKDLFKVGHNFSFDIQSLRLLADEYDYSGVDVWNLHDTYTMANVMGLPAALNELGSSVLGRFDLFSISDVLEKAREDTGKRNVTMLDADQEMVALKCCNDVQTTYGLYEQLLNKLTPKTFDCYEVDRRLTSILKTIELKGLKLNHEELKRQYDKLSVKCEILEDWADETYGVSIGSGAQVGLCLAEQGIFLPFTPSGRQYQTSEEILEKIDHPLAKAKINYDKTRKLLSTYVEPFMEETRGYTHFRLDLATGRLASYERNFQNIPPDMRAIFAPDNSIFTWGDMSNLEMRVIAYLAQDTGLLKAYAEGKSIHNLTFAAIFPNEPRKVFNPATSKEEDSPLYIKSKTFNFGMVFDASDNTLAAQCDISKQLAGQWKKIWFETFPGVARWMHSQQNTNSQLEETIFGRRMRIPNERGKHHANTCRINYPVQGSGADLNKRSILKMWDMGYLNEENFRLQVHDEIVLDGDYYDSFPHDEVTRIHPDIEIPWEIKKGPVWV